MISRGLYNIGIQLYLLGIRLKAIRDDKAQKWMEGRKNWPAKLKDGLGEKKNPRIWIHCASLGEFEQGRPVIEKLRQQFPPIEILLTFFSPSGYEVRQNYDQVDHVAYLPIDTRSNARQFLDLVQPDVALFVKYEFWYHYLTVLQQRSIPTLLFSAIFRQDQPFFQWYGALFRQMLKRYSYIFIQDQTSRELLGSLGLKNCEVAPDTRFDRVWKIAEQQTPMPEIEAFKGDHPTFIAGSTWPVDNLVLAHINLQNIKLIIAPHDVGEQSMAGIEKTFPGKTVRYSQLEKENSYKQVLIIDNIGMLAALYRYAEVVYVGGGFGEGIHNTLEPAVYGVPVLFGPHFQKFREARMLIEKGGAYSAKTQAAIGEKVNELMENEKVRLQMGQAAGQLVKDNLGGTARIVEMVSRFI